MHGSKCGTSWRHIEAYSEEIFQRRWKLIFNIRDGSLCLEVRKVKREYVDGSQR